MTKETLLEVVDKLTGYCYPYGDTSIDEKRYENLELKIALVSYLLDHIEEAGKLYDRHEFSIKKISSRANAFLTDVRDTLLEIEYLPPIDPEIVPCEECRWKDICSQVVSGLDCAADATLRWCSDGERLEE